MTTVPSATVPSATSFLWNNKNYLLLAGGLGVILFIAYRYFNRETSNNKTPDLTHRLIAAQFPQCANVKPKSASEVSGIIRINLLNAGVPLPRNPLDLLVIEYTHKGKTFSMPMTILEREAEAYVRHLPSGEDIHLQFKYQNTQPAGLTLKVDQKFGIYEIYIEEGNWKVDFHPETPPIDWRRLDNRYDADTSLALSISPPKLDTDTETRIIKPESHYYLTNTTQKVHILFFEIAGYIMNRQTEDLRLVVPIAVLPATTIIFPKGFLRASWEHTYQSTHGKKPPSNPRLTILGILDTAAPD